MSWYVMVHWFYSSKRKILQIIFVHELEITSLLDDKKVTKTINFI